MDIFFTCVLGVFCLFEERKFYPIHFFAKKSERSVLRHYNEFSENTVQNRFYPMRPNIFVVF